MHKRVFGTVLVVFLLSPIASGFANTDSETEAEALRCLSLAIYHEARGEPYLGQLAVAWVVMNRVTSRRWPDTVCEVVWQRHQFSWTNDGRSDRPRERKAWQQVQDIARLVYRSEAANVIGEATHYHASYIRTPGWAHHFTLVAAIGKHLFYQ